MLPLGCRVRQLSSYNSATRECDFNTYLFPRKATAFSEMRKFCLPRFTTAFSIPKPLIVFSVTGNHFSHDGRLRKVAGLHSVSQTCSKQVSNMLKTTKHCEQTERYIHYFKLFLIIKYHRVLSAILTINLFFRIISSHYDQAVGNT